MRRGQGAGFAAALAGSLAGAALAAVLAVRSREEDERKRATSLERGPAERPRHPEADPSAVGTGILTAPLDRLREACAAAKRATEEARSDLTREWEHAKRAGP